MPFSEKPVVCALRQEATPRCQHRLQDLLRRMPPIFDQATKIQEFGYFRSSSISLRRRLHRRLSKRCSLSQTEFLEMRCVCRQDSTPEIGCYLYRWKSAASEYSAKSRKSRWYKHPRKVPQPHNDHRVRSWDHRNFPELAVV